MMTFLFVTLPLIVIAWVFCSGRELVLSAGRWVLRRRYEVSLSGVDCVDPDKIYLVVPNHPAIVDPLLVVTELYRLRILIRPLVDESFFSHRLTRHVLSVFDAVRVPDLGKKNFRPVCRRRPSRIDSARRAKSLGYTVLATLTNGKNVLLYPSGHITPDGKETIGNRQLAYNVATQLPADVNILAVRTRGLYGSIWSRVKGRPAPPYVKTLVRSSLLWLVAGFRKRRKVSMHFEDITERCRKWASLGRAGFNLKMEEWYDSDLTATGCKCEGVS